MRKRDGYDAAGLCLDCGAARDNHTKRCSVCRDKRRASLKASGYSKKRYWERRNAGVCQKCDAQRLPDDAYCKKCRERIKKQSRAVGRTYHGLKAAGICVHCQSRKPEKPGHTRCNRCAAWSNNYQKERAEQKWEAGDCFHCKKAAEVFVGDGALGRTTLRKRKGKTCYCRPCYFRVTDTRYKLPTGTCEAQFKAQDGRCAYTGEPLVLGENASLDHRNPDGPKDDPSNVQWALWVVNRMKRDSRHEAFLSLVERISDTQRGNP